MTDNELGAFITLILTLGVTIILVAQTIARRNPGVAPKELASMDARLARIEQAVDAMSIEVERISEGQRFATKLLSERAAEAAPAQRLR